MGEPLHTYCKCEKCGATVRDSRHSETDCDTIRELRERCDALEWWMYEAYKSVDSVDEILVEYREHKKEAGR